MKWKRNEMTLILYMSLIHEIMSKQLLESFQHEQTETTLMTY